MIDFRTVSLSLLAAGVILPAQKGATPKPKPSKAQQLVAELNRDDRWERAAARLVLLRSKATKPLAEALRTAGKKGNDKVAKRILAVLGRLGLDASKATNSVWNALDGLGVDVAIVGLDTVIQITRPGGAARLERPSFHQPYKCFFHLVGVTRFELATSRFQSEDSNQTELHPVGHLYLAQAGVEVNNFLF